MIGEQHLVELERLWGEEGEADNRYEAHERAHLDIAELVAEVRRLRAISRCGRTGYRAGDRPCTADRGHDGPCSWDS